MLKLVAKDGKLYFPQEVKDSFGNVGPILICVYDQGDCDLIEWPDYNLANLICVLFDERECGTINCDEVMLPDGSTVRF